MVHYITCEVRGKATAMTLATWLIHQRADFCVCPLPGDAYQFAVKPWMSEPVQRELTAIEGCRRQLEQARLLAPAAPAA